MDQQPTWIGRTLSGRYRIDAMLGQGGMSAVYKATDPNLKRAVAIKLIHSHLSSDPSFVMRFESEASAVASLRHPNIVQVYDFNNDGGVYYMVLEFIPGETLQDRMQRTSNTGRQLSIEDAIKYTANISDAIGYAHNRGMVHRDIKPANIMLDVQGQAILMDFGIVKILGGDSHTSTGAVVGTARYMSPEIIRGEVADHRADIYSLGVTLFEMLGGRPPFMADSAMTLMMMHLNDPIPNVRDFRQDVPAEMVRILEKCLTKDRSERYQSASDLSADLRRALVDIGGHPISVSVPGMKKPQIDNQTVVEPATPKPTGSQPVPQTYVEASPAQPDDSQASSQTYLEQAPVKEADVKETGSRSIPEAAGTSLRSSMPAVPTGLSRRPLLLAGAGLAVIACLAVAVIGGRFLLSGINAPPEPTATVAARETSAVTEEPVAVVLATETMTPTQLPTETVSPTLSPTPEGPYVVITDIQVESNLYIVDYEVHNLDDTMHVHMFFDTVPPEQAGSPAAGPWKLTWNVYGDPPFTQYGIANRPAGATQMCSLVARSNHSVILGTGNCIDLPEE